MKVVLATVLAALLLLTGCSTTGPLVQSQAKIEQALSDIADFEDADLAQALALTPAADIEASTCWNGLRPITAELKALKGAGQPLVPQVKGVFSAYQIVRNGVRTVLGVNLAPENKPSLMARINVACGPLVASANVDAARLALKASGDVGAASTGIGALPVVLKAFSALRVLLPVPVPLP